MFDLEKLVESYCGDLCWLEEIERQMCKISTTNKEQIKRFGKAEYLIKLLYKLNYVVIETETNTIAEKYYEQMHEVYAEMKYDLTTLLGINDFWEMI